MRGKDDLWPADRQGGFGGRRDPRGWARHGVALGEAGATVYCTGRTTRQRRSEYDRPEAIEETAELVDAAGGEGIAVEVDHLQREQVTAVALTPGWMRSEMMLDNYRVTEENGRDAVGGNPHFTAISESPRFVGRAVAALAADPDLHSHNGGSFSSGQLAREYGFTDVDGSQPDCWRYMVEVQDAGRPADPTGYR